MLNLLETLNKSVDFLKGKGVPNPKLDAELLFAHVLKCNRLQLYLDFEKHLDEPTLNAIRSLIVKRGKREPLQHIIGDVSFFNLKLKTNKNALIPRPETEELLELIENKIGNKPLGTIIDLGTGTGAIALSLAKAYPGARVIATDKSTDALDLARENAKLNKLQNRVEFMESDWFTNISNDLRFDLIVSNPPYLTSEEYESAEPEVKDFEPKMALHSEDKGIRDLLRIMKDAYAFLSADAMLALETGIGQHGKLAEAARTVGYERAESCKDLNKFDRFFIGWK